MRRVNIIVMLWIIGHAYAGSGSAGLAQESVPICREAAPASHTNASIPCKTLEPSLPGPEVLDWFDRRSVPERQGAQQQMRLSPVVVIQAKGSGISGTGSGFLLQYQRHTYLVTAKHVLEDAKVGMELEDIWGRPISLQYDKFYMHAWADIALAELKSVPHGVRVYPLFTGVPFMNGHVHALGMVPGKGVLDYTGKLLGRYFSHPRRDDAEGYQSDSAIIPGMSGGPLLYRGAVLGVNSSRAAMESTDRTSYHTSIRYALDMMDMSTHQKHSN